MGKGYNSDYGPWLYRFMCLNQTTKKRMPLSNGLRKPLRGLYDFQDMKADMRKAVEANPHLDLHVEIIHVSGPVFQKSS